MKTFKQFVKENGYQTLQGLSPSQTAKLKNVPAQTLPSKPLPAGTNPKDFYQNPVYKPSSGKDHQNPVFKPSEGKPPAQNMQDNLAGGQSSGGQYSAPKHIPGAPSPSKVPAGRDWK